MISNSSNDKHDEYGFPNRDKYDRTLDYKPKVNKVSTKQLILYCIGGLVVIFWIFSAIISGQYAWNEFPNDSTLVKLARLWIAVIFAPVYIFYIFVKTSVFKQ